MDLPHILALQLVISTQTKQILGIQSSALAPPAFRLLTTEASFHTPVVSRFCWWKVIIKNPILPNLKKIRYFDKVLQFQPLCHKAGSCCWVNIWVGWLFTQGDRAWPEHTCKHITFSIFHYLWQLTIQNRIQKILSWHWGSLHNHSWTNPRGSFDCQTKCR